MTEDDEIANIDAPGDADDTDDIAADDSGLFSVGVWGHLDSLDAAALHDYVRAVADLGYDCLWVPETVGREPFTLLGAVAGDAGRMRLGTSIVSIWGHDAQTTKMAAMTLHELTGGRFTLGLGVSHAHLAQKLRGHTYEKPLTRMREFLDDYERLPYKGPGIADDPQRRGNAEPPLVLAALREGMVGLAVTRADGAFPYLVTAERIGRIRDVMDHAAIEANRNPGQLFVTLPVVLETDPERARTAARRYLSPYLRTPNYQASWEIQGFEAHDWTMATDRLVDAMVAWGDATAIRARIRAMHLAGADQVALIPLSPYGVTEHLPTLEALAPR